VSCRRFRVSGRVQGVGFRAFVARAGRDAGVRGGVRNERDGSVTAVATGDDAALERFAAALAAGPRFARVEAVAGEELAAPPAGERFELEF
jgi:acylphosphatase